MAKRKRAKTRTIYKKAKTRRRKSSGKVSLIDVYAIGYGGLREYASSWINSIASKLPAVGQLTAQYGDEAVMGVGNYFLAKNMKGSIRKLALKGLVVENARVGANISQNIPQLGSGTTGATSVQSTNNGMIIIG